MGVFSQWLKNIIIISVSFTLLNLMLPKSMAKYVKIITGFVMMLVVIQPFTQILDADVYYDNLYIKHDSMMNESQELKIDDERALEDQRNLTVFRNNLKSCCRRVYYRIRLSNLPRCRRKVDWNENRTSW